MRKQNSLEQTCLEAFTPAIRLERPETITSPYIFCSPHSGHHYPADFISRSHYPLNVLRRNEDAYIDTLFSPAYKNGAPLLSARFPRCFVDVNRAPNELPQAWLAKNETPTARAAAGLGVVPTALAENAPIYRRKLKFRAVKPRLEALYYPYHDALKALITDTQARFGHAIIVDCHSMPGFAPSGARRADIVLGDRYGTSCTPETITLIERLFAAKGYSVARNHPYAGSYVTSHYGQPHKGVEAIQIEVNRDLYLNPVTIKPKKTYESLAANLSQIIAELIQAQCEDTMLAAE